MSLDSADLVTAHSSGGPRCIRALQHVGSLRWAAFPRTDGTELSEACSPPRRQSPIRLPVGDGLLLRAAFDKAERLKLQKGGLEVGRRGSNHASEFGSGSRLPGHVSLELVGPELLANPLLSNLVSGLVVQLVGVALESV